MIEESPERNYGEELSEENDSEESPDANRSEEQVDKVFDSEELPAGRNFSEELTKINNPCLHIMVVQVATLPQTKKNYLHGIPG